MLTSMVAYTEIHALQKYFGSYDEVKGLRSEVDEILDKAEDVLESDDGGVVVAFKQEIGRLQEKIVG